LIVTRYSSLLVGVAILLTNVATLAQVDWPTKSVRIVVPNPPGGTTDIATRVVAEPLSKAFSQSFFVENRPGANGSIGATEVARSAPDGYTFLVGASGTLAINQFIFSKLSYNTEKDFAPVSLLIRVPLVVMVHPALGVKSIQELIDLARAKPKSISYGSPASASTGHLATELLKMRAGIDVVHIPYKGSAPMLQDLIAGQVQLAIDTLASAMPHIRSGKLVALAVTSSTPVAALPNVPTVASVIPGFEAEAWFAVMAPAGTPQSIIAKFSAEVDKIVHRPDVIDRFRQLGAEPVGGTPAELRMFIVNETTKWHEVVKATGAKVD